MSDASEDGMAVRTRCREWAVRLLPTALYILVGGVFAWRYRYHVSSDATGYLDMARLWSEARFPDLVTGYWGPLLPVLVAPLLLVGVAGLTAGKLVGFLSGLGFVVAVQGLAARRHGTAAASAVGVVLAVPAAILSDAVFSVLPDALLGTVSALILWTAMRFAEAPRLRMAAALGAWVGVAYLCKTPAYMLYLPSTAALLVFARGRRAQRGAGRPRLAAIALRGGAALLAFALVAGTWVALLSWRTGTFTLGSATDRILAFQYRRAGYDAPLWQHGPLYTGERWLFHNPWVREVPGEIPFHPMFHIQQAVENVPTMAQMFLPCALGLLAMWSMARRLRRGLRSTTRWVPALYLSWMLVPLLARRMETRYLLYVVPLVVPSAAVWARRLLATPRSRVRALLAGSVLLLAAAGVARRAPLRPLGQARFEGARAAATSLGPQDRVWFNQSAVGTPISYFLDRRLHLGAPDDGPPWEPDLPEVVVWVVNRRTPSPVPVEALSRNHEPLVAWREEDGTEVEIWRLRR